MGLFIPPVSTAMLRLGGDAMNLTNAWIELPAGFYVLTASGDLGVYDAQRNLHIDASLSDAFREHNRSFLRSYLSGSQSDEFRLAILYETLKTREWGRLTLSLEDGVVRDLYSTGGRAGALTVFQQKNREKSAYRGMELLLESRHESAPEIPVYCPVLFDAHASLAKRVSALGREPDKAERDIQVLDVLNLIAGIPSARRGSPEILALVDKLRQGIIRKDQRRDIAWEIQHAKHSSPLPSSADAYAQIARDKRMQRALTLPNVDGRRLHESEYVEPIERWLKIPHQPVGSERLRSFAQFRELDDARIDELSARSFLYTAPGGTRLLERGLQDSWNLYLLEGTLMLTPADGTTLKVVGGSDKATYPIALLKPRKYQVDTLTPVSFLWVHDLLLEVVTSVTTAPPT